MMEVVVLLHGLGRTPLSMTARRHAAPRRGYRVINWHYRSTTGSIAEHAQALARDVMPRVAGASRVHFVTHSLGGIIVRQFLDTHTLPNLGRVVMLAPPNGGSEVADRLQRSDLVTRCVVPAGELGTNATSVPRALPAATFPLGVIAGSRSHIRLFSRWMNDVPNDGVVAVERTKLAGMADFIVLHRTHTLLPWSPDAVAQVFRFLERGSFDLAA
jgi:pimeloyl-ACP methyl ester carboxylesterase